jgi:hypothetical protein
VASCTDLSKLFRGGGFVERKFGLRVIFVAVILAAVLMVPFVLQRGTINQLRAENTRLSSRVADLSQSLAEATRAQTSLSTNQSGSFPREQLHELMRLRAEVGELRRQTNSIQAGPRAGVQPATAGQPTPPPTNPPALDSELASAGQGTNTVVAPPWRNAGFARPSDAASTFLWAAQQGTAETVMSAMTPEVQAEWQQQIASGAATADALKSQIAAITALRPSPNHQSTETDAFFVTDSFADHRAVRTQPGDPATLNPPAATQQTIRFQKVGQQWLYAGRVGP